MGASDSIEKIKEIADCRILFRRFWPTHFKEQGNCFCPFHEDSTPSLQVDSTFAFCHAEGKKWDAIDLYEAGTGTGRKEAINLLADELGLTNGNGQKPVLLTDAAIRYLKSRGIEREVDRFIRAGARSLNGNPAKGWSESIAVPLTDWTGKPLGSQILPLDGGIKKFKTGTPGKEAFFRLKGTGPVIVTDGVFDALAVAEAIPGANVCSILSAVFTGKLSCLQGTDETVILFLDNDGPGREGDKHAASLLAGKCKLRSVPWCLAPEGIKDPNDLLKAGHADIIKRMVEEAEERQD
ncbi:MAG: hypothetical protein GX433_08530, partial [Deltaproteobacteria bacterium]|nr:hypothetical protein [Deltaproteobacteria bacterium]